MGVDKTLILAECSWWKGKVNTWESRYRIHWNVKYVPGGLKIKAYKDGNEMTEKVIVMAGEVVIEARSEGLKSSQTRFKMN